MEPKDVEVFNKSTAFDGFFRIDRYSLRHHSFKGGWGPSVNREIFERGHAVAVLPYDPNLDRLIMTQQFRIGAYTARNSEWFANNYSPWLIEGVAGIIEAGEKPEDVASRETIEETGCFIEKLEYIGHYFVSPGGSSESIFSYLGKIDSKKGGGIYGIADEGEDLKTFAVPIEEAFSWIDNDNVSNGTTLIMLMWLRHHHTRIRELWNSS